MPSDCAASLPAGDDSARLEDRLRDRATQLGFELCGIAPAVSPTGFDRLQEWIDRGFAGEMAYIPRRTDAYRHPEGVLPSVRSVIVVAMNYHAEAVPAGQTSEGLHSESATAGGRVARYAAGSVDYHDLLKQRLQQLAAFLHDEKPGCRTRPVVDSAPLLERDFARLAGLGWFGKNTMLINRRLGSWLFLGALLTDVALEPDAPHETSHCGTCTRCLDACPTDAFAAPYILDARRCISYLTIELRDQPISEPLRDGMGSWVFGCDICQDVCPWNRKAPLSSEPAFAPQADLSPINFDWLLSLTEEEFRVRFRGTPFERPGRAGLLRNAAIAAGNSGNRTHLPALMRAAAADCELIREAAVWAIRRLEAAT
ncbi:tRNA epoxyqueuosine(34) reductase QueG [bacterium]|nr:tRNA epoxyqueuosine(34) reductase QueG [bacterium]